jgi:hypothetical protein
MGSPIWVVGSVCDTVWDIYIVPFRTMGFGQQEDVYFFGVEKYYYFYALRQTHFFKKEASLQRV